jgi:O-succinylbenzoic acid--CoA ligase
MTYGMSETASQIATTLPGDMKPGTVGRPLLFTQVRIVDEQGRDVPTREYGEIVVKSPALMRGYDGQPPVGEEFKTGDIGYLDEDGDLWLVQRRSDLIISGGENIYPAEIENILRQHPDIEEAVVVGVPDAEWGQAVAAAIVGTIKVEDVEPYCRQHLAGYKIPRRVRMVDALPLTASGKINRAAVKELFT